MNTHARYLSFGMARELVMGVAAFALVGTPLRAADPRAASDPPDPLAGPSVKPEEAAPSLVDRTFAGEMKRPDVRPEEAALRKLQLSDAERAATDRVLAERASMLDGLVRENIGLLLRLQAARASGDRAALGAVNKELREVLRPLAAKGRLQEQIRSALEPENAAKYDGLVRGYYRAILAEGKGTRPKRGGGEAAKPPAERAMRDEEAERTSMDQMPHAAPHDAPHAAPDSAPDSAPPEERRERARLLLEVFGQEVRRSYERIAAEGQSRLDEVAKALDLTPAQEAKVRALAAEFAQKSQFKPTQAQRAELFGNVLRELTPEQRVRALELLRGRR